MRTSSWGSLSSAHLPQFPVALRAVVWLPARKGVIPGTEHRVKIGHCTAIRLQTQHQGLPSSHPSLLHYGAQPSAFLVFCSQSRTSSDMSVFHTKAPV